MYKGEWHDQAAEPDTKVGCRTTYDHPAAETDAHLGITAESASGLLSRIQALKSFGECTEPTTEAC